MIWAYAALCLLIALAAPDLKDVRWCALVVCGALLATKGVTAAVSGLSAYALWSSIWCVAAVLCSRQMWCSALLFASGLCYLPVYLAGFSVGPGQTASIVVDALGLAALAVLGGQAVGNRFHMAGVVRFLAMGYPRLRADR